MARGFKMVETKVVVAPPVAAKATYLKDADGNLYLWTAELAQRGDLVAAYDPNKPEAHAEEFKAISLNRELELARQKADMEEAARLAAEKAVIEAEELKKEADAIALANERNLQIVQEELEKAKAEHAKQMAEMQAKLDAMANNQIKSQKNRNGASKNKEVKKEKRVVDAVQEELNDEELKDFE